MMLRAAVIGCGWAGSRFNEGRRRASIFAHAAAYDRLPGVRLQCVADPDRDRLTACQRAWKVPAAYTDYRKMLRCESLDIASICTPDETHAEVARAVLSTPGIQAILCEKPLASSLREAKIIVRWAERAKVILAVNYSRRYVEGYQRVARLFRERMFGQLIRMHAFYSGGLIHNGTHLLDLLLWFLGPPQAVQTSPGGEDGQMEALDVFVRYPGDASLVLQGIPSRTYPLFELDVLGSSGRLKIARDGALIQTFAVREHLRGFDRRSLSHEAKTLCQELKDPTLYAVQDLLAAIRRRREPLCTGRDGMRALALGEAILRSAATRKSVPFRDPNG